MTMLRDHTDPSRLLKYVLFMAMYASSFCYAYDCNVGCDLDVAVNGGIVCGNDNNEYPNECFAVCQNVNIVKKEPCSVKSHLRNRIFQDNIASVQTGFITIETMKQYEKEGFKLIRKWDTAKLDGDVSMPMVTADMIKEMKHKKKSRLPKRNSYTPLLMNSEGYEYIGNKTFFRTEDSMGALAPRSVPGYYPLLGDDQGINGTRMLEESILGVDTRKKIRRTTIYPYTFIGAMGYDPDEYFCSGTVIARSAVLTAAHCLYDANKQTWANNSYFAPGRGNRGIDFNDPYGRWPIESLIFPGEYVNDQLWAFDYAVVRLGPNSRGKYIGDVVGYAGLDEVTGYNDVDLDKSTITGYPGDKGGRTMWTAGLCPSGFVSGKSYGNKPPVVYHDCDVTGGMSGSSFMRISGVTNNDFRVRGVFTFGTGNASIFPWNGGNAFFTGNGIYDAIMEWSGRLE